MKKIINKFFRPYITGKSIYFKDYYGNFYVIPNGVARSGFTFKYDLESLSMETYTNYYDPFWQSITNEEFKILEDKFKMAKELVK